MRHYTVDELDTYNTGAMNLLSKLRCTTHLKNCRECQARLETAMSNDSLIAQVRESWSKLNPEIIDHNWEKSYDLITRSLK